MQKVREKARSKITLFKWDINLPNNIEPTASQGLLLLTVKERLTVLLPTGKTAVETYELPPMVSLFQLASLSSRDSIEALAKASVSSGCKLISFVDIQDCLQAEITNYLCDNFQFCVDSLQSRNSPKTVIVIQIFQSRYVDNKMNQMQVAQEQGRPEELERLCAEDNFSGFPDIDIEGIFDHLLKNLSYVPITYFAESIQSHESFGFVQVPPLEMFQVCEMEEDEKPMEICSICLEGFSKGTDVRKTDCSHMFHGVCFSRWLWRGLNCPICRVSLT